MTIFAQKNEKSVKLIKNEFFVNSFFNINFTVNRLGRCKFCNEKTSKKTRFDALQENLRFARFRGDGVYREKGRFFRFIFSFRQKSAGPKKPKKHTFFPDPADLCMILTKTQKNTNPNFKKC